MDMCPQPAAKYVLVKSACLLVNLQFIPYLFHPISMLEREFAPTIGRDSINNKSVFRQQAEIPQEKGWDI